MFVVALDGKTYQFGVSLVIRRDGGIWRRAVDRNLFVFLVVAVLVTGSIYTLAASMHGDGRAGESPFHCVRCNVVVISVDMMRPDHMGVYGYGRNTTPHIERLSGNGVTFTNAISASSFTTASVFSVMTGRYPSHYSTGGDERRGTPETFTMLAEVFSEAGYETIGVGRGYFLGRSDSFRQGFDSYTGNPGENLLQEIEHTLRSGDDKPFFLYYAPFHLHPPYFPVSSYQDEFGHPNRTFSRSARWLRERILFCGRSTNAFPTNESIRRVFHRGLFADVDVTVEDALGLASRIRRNRSLCGRYRIWNTFWREYYYGQIRKHENLRRWYLDSYDMNVKRADADVGRLIGMIRDISEYDDTVVVLTSAHGVELGERRTWRNLNLYQEDIWIPLVVRIPGMPRQGAVRPQMVQNIDIAATVLDIAGISGERFLEQGSGQTLLPVMKGNASPPRSFAMSEIPAAEEIAFIDAETGIKYYYQGDGSPAVFNLSAGQLAQEEVQNETVRTRIRRKFVRTYERLVGESPFAPPPVEIRPYIPHG